jgi:hypothetical protein
MSILSKYQEWICAGANGYERNMLQHYTDLKGAHNILADIEVAATMANAAVTAATADITGAAKSLGAWALLAIPEAVKARQSQAINEHEKEAQHDAFNGNLERRIDEWALQSALAQQDKSITDQQISQANIQKQIVGTGSVEWG